MDSPGFLWLLSYSSWFCLTSTTHLIQIRSGASDFILTFEQFACMDSLLVLCGFHNSLNTNPKRSGASDFILTFEQFACMDSLLVLCGFFPTAPGFVWLPQLD